MRRTPVPVSRSSRPALRHDPSGSPYLDYRSHDPVEPQQDGADADEEPTERFARIGPTPRVQELPPIFARRLDPREPEPVADDEPDARGVARFFEWLGRPRLG